MSIENKLWFEQDEDKIENIRVLAPPFDNITIGTTPMKGMTLKTAQSYDTFINVSEEASYSYRNNKPRPDTKFFYAKIIELEPWGYWPFYYTRGILDDEFDKGRKVYLHCIKGINRSPCIAMGWLISRGYDIEAATKILNRDNIGQAESDLQRFYSNEMFSYIPSRLEEMYGLQKKGKNLKEILAGFESYI